MVAHGGESPTRKANACRHVAHATDVLNYAARNLAHRFTVTPLMRFASLRTSTVLCQFSKNFFGFAEFFENCTKP